MWCGRGWGDRQPNVSTEQLVITLNAMHREVTLYPCGQDWSWTDLEEILAGTRRVAQRLWAPGHQDSNAQLLY